MSWARTVTKILMNVMIQSLPSVWINALIDPGITLVLAHGDTKEMAEKQMDHPRVAILIHSL